MSPDRPSPGGAGGRVIFLLSSERSGSTLLRVILGRHPALIAPNELFLLCFPTVDEWRHGRPLAIESVLEYLEQAGHPTTAQGLEQRWRGHGSMALYDWLLSQLPADTRLLDKTPAYATHREILDSTRQWDPFYIWLIRHPLGAVDSYLRLKRQGFSAPRRVLKLVKDRIQRGLHGGLSRKGRRREDLWVRQNSNIEAFLETVTPGRQYRLAFESLVREPEVQVRRLCDAAGLTWRPRLLARPQSEVEVVPGLGDPNFARHEGISAETADTWRSRYDESVLSPAAARLMRETWLPLCEDTGR